MKLTYSKGFQRWGGVLIWGLISTICIITYFSVFSLDATVVTIPIFVISMLGGLASLVFLGVAIFTAVAIGYAERYKAHGKEPDFHKELRRLRRLHRKYARSLMANKGYTHSASVAYRSLIDTERDIARHLEEPYEEPVRSPSRY